MRDGKSPAWSVKLGEMVDVAESEQVVCRGKRKDLVIATFLNLLSFLILRISYFLLEFRHRCMIDHIPRRRPAKRIMGITSKFSYRPV